MEEEQKKEHTDEVARSINPRAWWVAAITAVLVFLAIGGSAFAYGRQYEGKIYPGVSVGGVDVGGKTPEEASALLQQRFQDMLAQEERVEIEGTIGKIDLHVTTAEDTDLSYDLLSFDADATARSAYDINRTQNIIGALSSRLFPTHVTPTISVRSEQLTRVILSAFPALEQPGAETDFLVTWQKDVPTITVIAGTTGTTIDTAQAATLLIEDAQDFTLSGITLKRMTSVVMVNEAEASSLIPQAQAAIENAPFTFTYTGDDKKEHTWTVDEKTIADWILPTKKEDGSLFVGVNEAQVTEWLKDVHGELDVAPENARFTIEGEKVTEFKGSQEGVSVNDAAIIQALSDALSTKNATVTIAVATVEPTITTGSVNDLGIKEILGVGYSNYGRSPSNRIKNIVHGAGKLDGMLIAPGETFSAIEHLRPFTLEDGYFPELVIKGDQITPEIGGGLCQIGTTLFRAAMNSGLEILERRNHSLTVSYYNDPSNGQPGTDATLYDPNPDLKFVNNTGNYILITTEVNQNNGDLHFTMWGTSDGRKAWYDPPVVLATMSAGADRITETTTLAPGVEKCQSAHYGASTTFAYHVVAADGTEVIKDFPSYYRPLPRICLVGVDPNAAPPAEEGTSTEGTEAEGTEEAPASTDTETPTTETETAN